MTKSATQVLVDAELVSINVPNSNELIVDSASFQVYAGELLVIIGPNGAGKSTLLNGIAGSAPLSSGRLTFNGFSETPKLRARQVATLPQISLLNSPYLVEEVVMLGRIPHDSGFAIDQEIVTAALQSMDIEYLAKRYYTDLSGGEKQRVQLARVFAQIWRADDIPSPLNSNRLLLLDEPTSALDLGHQADLMRAIRRFSDAGVAVVMVAHDINLAARYADRLLAMQCSQLVASGSVDELITKANMEKLFATKLDVLHDPNTGIPYVTHQQ